MGFNVTALAQKARTQTLIVDSDLDMGQYDIIATDVKGDTAEFSEFVGGVGNFESGLISGGLDVGDILHAESSMQIDGDLVVEGAINNVNITNEGAISTAKSVTATGGFIGAKYTRTTNYTVSSNIPADITGYYVDMSDYICILPIRDKPYNGTITLKKNALAAASTVYYLTSLNANAVSSVELPSGSYGTANLTLSNAQCLYISKGTGYGIGDITIS